MNKTFETSFNELVNTKETVKSNISRRHQELDSLLSGFGNVMEDFVESFETSKPTMDDRDIAVNKEIDKISKDLDDLLNELI